MFCMCVCACMDLCHCVLCEVQPFSPRRFLLSVTPILRLSGNQVFSSLIEWRAHGSQRQPFLKWRANPNLLCRSLNEFLCLLGSDGDFAGWMAGFLTGQTSLVDLKNPQSEMWEHHLCSSCRSFVWCFGCGARLLSRTLRLTLVAIFFPLLSTVYWP